MSARKWGEHPDDGKGLQRIAERLKRERTAQAGTQAKGSEMRSAPSVSGIRDAQIIASLMQTTVTGRARRMLLADIRGTCREVWRS